MTVTGTNDQPTQRESNTQNTQTNETPISQRGSGQNVLFTTPLARAQAAASQVHNNIRDRSQQQTAGNGAGSAGVTNTGAGINNMSVADFMHAMSQQMHVHDFRRDGEKVNIRGGIDRVLREQVPKELADRNNWIKAARETEYHGNLSNC